MSFTEEESKELEAVGKAAMIDMMQKLGLSFTIEDGELITHDITTRTIFASYKSLLSYVDDLKYVLAGCSGLVGTPLLNVLVQSFSLLLAQSSAVHQKIVEIERRPGRVSPDSELTALEQSLGSIIELLKQKPTNKKKGKGKG